MRRLAVIGALLWGLALNSQSDTLQLDGLSRPIKQAIAAARARALESSASEVPGLASTAWGEFGMLLQAQNLYTSAIAAYRQALEYAPDMRWMYLRAVSLTELGRIEEATSFFEAIVKNEPGVHTIWYRLANVYLVEGRYEEAAEAFDRALELAPDHAAILYGRALVASHFGSHQKALQLLDRAWQIEPQAGQIAYQLALVLRRLGERELFVEWLALRNDIAPAIEDPLLVQVSAFSLSASFYATAARRAWQRGDLITAAEASRKAVSLAPDDLALRLDLVRVLSHMRSWDEVVQEARDLVAIEPDSSEAWYLLGTALLRSDRENAATEAVTQALSQAPSEELSFLQAALAMRLGNFEVASALFAELASSLQQSDRFRYWQSLALYRNAKPVRALDLMRQVSTAAPEYGEAQIALARMEALHGEPRIALETAKRLQGAVDSLDVQLTLAFARLAVGDFDSVRAITAALSGHLDAQMLRDAERLGEPPPSIFHPSSNAWIPAVARTDQRNPVADD